MRKYVYRSRRMLTLPRPWGVPLPGLRSFDSMSEQVCLSLSLSLSVSLSLSAALTLCFCLTVCAPGLAGRQQDGGSWLAASLRSASSQRSYSCGQSKAHRHLAPHVERVCRGRSQCLRARQVQRSAGAGSAATNASERSSCDDLFSVAWGEHSAEQVSFFFSHSPLQPSDKETLSPQIGFAEVAASRGLGRSCRSVDTSLSLLPLFSLSCSLVPLAPSLPFFSPSPLLSLSSLSLLLSFDSPSRSTLTVRITQMGRLAQSWRWMRWAWRVLYRAASRSVRSA